MKIIDEGNSEEKNAEKEHKYFERLNKEYKIYVKKRQRHSKNAVDFNKFKRKKIKSNSLFIKIYFADSIIFLVFAILIGRGMLVEGNIDVLGIIVLVVVFFIDVVTVLAAREFVRIKKQLVKIINF